MKPIDFSGELKHRRVYRAVGLYVVVMFGLWQAADIAIPALSLPQMLMRYIVGGALVGLPLVVTLSWLYDLKISRSEPRSPAASPQSNRTAVLATVGAVAVLLVGGLAYRTFAARTPVNLPLADPQVSFELGVERYFAGEAADAAPILEAVAADATTTTGLRQEALRYLLRTYSEVGDTVQARAAARRLVNQEPPLALMLPGVETEPVMELYYDARREKLGRSPRASVTSAVGAIAVLDFIVFGEAPGSLGDDEWRKTGEGVGSWLAADLFQQFDGKVAVVERSRVGRSYDVYRYLDSPDAAGLTKPTHLLIGSVTWRRDQLLLSAWLMDGDDGTLAHSQQVVGTYAEFFDLVAGLSKNLAQSMIGS